MINKDLIKIHKELSSLISMCKSKKLRHYYNKNVYQSRFLFFNNILASEVIDNSPYRNIILNFLKMSERCMPGGSLIAADMFCKKIISNKKYKPKFEKEKVSKESLVNIVNDFIFDDKNREIILNCLSFAGPNGSIYCKPSKNDIVAVTKTCSPRIYASLDESFTGVYFRNIDETSKTFISIAMDAYLERESEIMTLLEHAKKEKLPIVIFCRGMSENFKRNLKEIILKNSIYVYPYIVKFDNDDPFLLEDICSALNVEKVSAEAGDVFYKDLVKKSNAIKLKLSKDFIEFYDKPINAVNKISEKISESSDPSLNQYLIKRKNRLSPNITKIAIPESEIKLIQDMKSAVRLYNQIATGGVIKHDNVYYPKKSFTYIDQMTDSIVNSINQIGCVVKIKSEEKNVWLC